MKAVAIVMLLAGWVCGALAVLSALGIMPSIIGTLSIGAEIALGPVATSTIAWGWGSMLLVMSSITLAVFSTKEY
jgi:hypothetical protein